MLLYVKRFNLTDTLKQSMFSDNSSQYNYYKKLIKRVVTEKEITRWKVTSMFFYELPLFNHCIKKIELCVWWKFVKTVPSLFKQVSSVVSVISGCQPKSFQCNFNSNYCFMCIDYARDTAQHVLFECSSLIDIRDVHLNKLKFTMPLAMKRDFY